MFLQILLLMSVGFTLSLITVASALASTHLKSFSSGFISYPEFARMSTLEPILLHIFTLHVCSLTVEIMSIHYLARCETMKP